MALSFTQIATDLISQLGYGGLTIGLVVDSAGLPIPSEVLIPLATVLGLDGRFNIWAVFFIGTFAQVAGGLAGYYVGRYGGEPVLEKYGKYVLISHKDLKRTHKVFEKYGIWMTMVGRCVPVVRGLIAYPAGIAEMNVGKFMLYTAVGSAVWTAMLMWLGLALRDHLEVIDQVGTRFSAVVLLLIVAWVAWHFRHLWDRKQPKA